MEVVHNPYLLKNLYPGQIGCTALQDHLETPAATGKRYKFFCWIVHPMLVNGEWWNTDYHFSQMRDRNAWNASHLARGSEVFLGKCEKCWAQTPNVAFFKCVKFDTVWLDSDGVIGHLVTHRAAHRNHTVRNGQFHSMVAVPVPLRFCSTNQMGRSSPI